MTFNSVGHSKKRLDAVEKVTGQAKFVDDIYLPKMLYAKVLRAEYAHAKILSIDTSKAEELDGVIKVITGKNCNIHFGACIKDQMPLAVDKVRHMGEPVAVVVADTEKIAQAATKLINVSYDPLPVIIDPIKSIQPEAPLIHEKNGEYTSVSGFYPVKNSNIFHHYKLRKGNIESGFEKCNIILEDNFEFPHMSHVALEPHGAICRWDAGDGVSVWASSQAPFVIREIFSHMFNLPYNKIHVHIPYLGGGFGGKSDVSIEPLCAYVAKCVPGYAVKLVLTRKEVFTSSFVGRGMKGKMKIGAKNDGTLVAIQSELYFADGAYADTSCNVVTAAGHNCTGPYKFTHCHLDSFGIYTNTTPVGAYRGYGHPEGQFMVERLLDKLARKLNMSPFELRRKNALGDGTTNALGQIITKDNGDIDQCLSNVEKEIFSTPKPDETDEFIFGRGMAAMMKSPVMASNAASCAFIRFNEDASVTVNISGIEMGQGSQTVLGQIAAETLKLPLEKVRVAKTVDTDFSPHEWQTVASMTTYRAGNAIIKACNAAIIELKRTAAEVFECTVNDVEYTGNSLIFENEKLSLKEVVAGYRYSDGHTIGNHAMGVGTHIVPGVTGTDPDTGQGNSAAEWTFGAQGAEIKISKKTGKITVLNYVSSFDVGQVINPQLARIQIVGGVLQGLGHTLKEKVDFNKDGKMTNPTLVKYQIPRLSDMPEKYTVEFVETPQHDGPYGARPMAEHPIVPVAPVILNAIADATGIDFHKVPITPEKMLAALGGEINE